MRYLVYVHGTCDKEAGYSDDRWNALYPFTTVFGHGQLGQTRLEVLWSDVISSHEYTSTNPLIKGPHFSDLDDLQCEIERDVKGRDFTNFDRLSSADSWKGCVANFVVYLLDNNARQKVIDRFVSVVLPLLENGQHIDIIAHSWGSVVSYEGIRQIERSGFKILGQIGTYFTVGAALSIPTVYHNLLPANVDGAVPSFVDQWINISAQGDPFGGPLKGPYKVTKDIIGFPATNCDQLEPFCCHESYWNPKNVYVNKDIFASYINSEVFH
jgi:hypothetical protein